MLLRGANAVGYTSYPDNVIQEFVREAHKQGIDIFRVFDSLNSIENMRDLARRGSRNGRGVRSGDLLHGRYIRFRATEIFAEVLRCDGKAPGETRRRISWPSRTWRACAGPTRLSSWSTRLREEIEIPIHFHTHDTSGVNAASDSQSRDAGVDVADAAIASMSGGTSQPNLNAIVAALQHTPRDTGLDLEALNECSDYWETVRTYYAPFDSGPKAGSARLYEHEIPGGQFTNLREQAAAMGLGHRWREVERTYAEVNQLFGDIVKVTPSSKVRRRHDACSSWQRI